MGHCHENWYANVKLKEGDQSTKFGRSNTIHLQSKKEPTLKFLIQVAWNTQDEDSLFIYVPLSRKSVVSVGQNIHKESVMVTVTVYTGV